VTHLQNSTAKGLTKELECGGRRVKGSFGLREQRIGFLAQKRGAGI
jgi:hypothetical protein